MTAFHSGVWIQARRVSRCAGIGCHHEIFRGESVLYIPAERACYCRSCAPQAPRVVGFVRLQNPYPSAPHHPR